MNLIILCKYSINFFDFLFCFKITDFHHFPLLFYIHNKKCRWLDDKNWLLNDLLTGAPDEERTIWFNYGLINIKGQLIIIFQTPLDVYLLQSDIFSYYFPFDQKHKEEGYPSPTIKHLMICADFMSANSEWLVICRPVKDTFISKWRLNSFTCDQ